jgi:thiopurine S-methyltransferase
VEREFWLEKWQAAKPGFHQEKVNSRLKKYWDMIEQALKSNPELDGGTTFVPLCGSTIDMHWLTENGFDVLGVEFSEVACRKYFTDNELEFEESNNSSFRVFKGAGIELWQGDFFALQAQDLSNAGAVYDRASLIALPPAMRQRYAQHLSGLLRPRCPVLLISMNYDESKMKGPPFSVDETEVRQLFEEKFSVELIAESSGPDIVGNLANRGLDTLTEKVYVLKRKSN